MTKIKLKVVDAKGNVISEKEADNYVSLVFEREYEEGDKIIMSVSESCRHIVWRADDALNEAMCYVTGDVEFKIPSTFEEKAVYSERSFTGIRHYIYARLAEDKEIMEYRNLALNPLDQYGITGAFPHATENVGDRIQWNFVPSNAIDGFLENESHVRWPYTAWGINLCDHAEMTVNFGRTVEIDMVKIWLRADFPHDSWWTHMTVDFSDGSSEVLSLVKTGKGQEFHIDKRNVEWVKIHSLVKADDESNFPALTQVGVFGNEIK